MTISRHIRRELPPIVEAWREVSSLSRYPYSSYPPVRRREEQAGRLLKDVRTLISFEEVYGKGLLERFNERNKACGAE